MQLDDNSRVEVGLAYHDYPMDLREGTNRLKVAYTDVSGTLNYIRQDTLFGHDSKTTLGLRTTQAMPNNGAAEYVRTPAGNTAGYAPAPRPATTVIWGPTPCCISATIWSWSLTCG